MTMENNIKSMNTSTQHDDFKTQWQRRQQWQAQAEKSAPDDENLLRWAEKAQQSSAGPEPNVIYFSSHRSNRWIPYMAAASLILGVTVIGLTRQNQSDNKLPVAKKVTVNGQTIHFLCNNGCSAQDIILSANEVIK